MMTPSNSVAVTPQQRSGPIDYPPGLGAGGPAGIHGVRNRHGRSALRETHPANRCRRCCARRREQPRPGGRRGWSTGCLCPGWIYRYRWRRSRELWFWCAGWHGVRANQQWSAIGSPQWRRELCRSPGCCGSADLLHEGRRNHPGNCHGARCGDRPERLDCHWRMLVHARAAEQQHRGGQHPTETRP